MKTRFFLGTLALVFVLTAVGFADQAADEYDKLMKPAVAANMKLTMDVRAGTDMAAVATDAGDVKTAFAAIEQYWSMKSATDGVSASKAIEAAADEVQTAAKAGNKDGVTAAQMKIGANCGTCHMAHRVRNPDNTWSIK